MNERNEMGEEVKKNAGAEEEKAPSPEEKTPEAAQGKDKKNEKEAAANDKYLRMMAEYDNFRKRSRAEKDGAYADACADVLKTLLPVFDNLKRAEAFSDSEKLADGVRMTMSQYGEALKSLGIEEFGEEGDAFDPNIHNAVMQQQRGDLEENTVVNVLQRGYRKGDRTIRCATVIVSTK